MRTALPAGAQRLAGSPPAPCPRGTWGFSGPGAVSLAEDEPETLPWLISFEEFQEGRDCQGRTETTLRPATATPRTGAVSPRAARG
ncbi:hypothetical protein [Streptomonospora alba]|uniref:hypothetical protein n=1 Tax=Streptomonospora alba TaxID=183763 RepID=UPI0012EDB99F|nr:hypothetical protein [Streptomonospora alba]